MLASITPLGERGRRSRWSITVTAFLLGATVAGAVEGAVLGLIGSLLLGDSVGTQARLLVLTGGLVLAALLEVLLPAVPGPNRQVNERWLDEFRGWVYGLGFGAQLGLGITTVVSSAATYVALLAALLTGDVARGALVLGIFGAIRGLTPLATARVHRPEQLLAMHASLERWRAPVGRLALAVLAVMLAVAALGALA